MNNNEHEQLKPCPFCGSSYFDVMDKDTYEKSFGDGFMRITCLTCKMDNWNIPNEEMTYEEALSRMITKWNRRAQA